MNIAIGVKNFNISLIIQEEILKISQKFTVPEMCIRDSLYTELFVPRSWK